MITIHALFKAEPNDTEKTGRAAARAALSKLKQIELLAAEVRDPETGAPAVFTWEVAEDGITASIDGSDYVVAELKRRIEGLPEQGGP